MNELCGYNAYVTALKYGLGIITVMAILPRECLDSFTRVVCDLSGRANGTRARPLIDSDAFTDGRAKYPNYVDLLTQSI